MSELFICDHAQSSCDGCQHSFPHEYDGMDDYPCKPSICLYGRELGIMATCIPINQEKIPSMKLSDEKRFDAALKICLMHGNLEPHSRKKALKQVDLLWAEVQGNSHLADDDVDNDALIDNSRFSVYRGP